MSRLTRVINVREPRPGGESSAGAPATGTPAKPEPDPRGRSILRSLPITSFNPPVKVNFRRREHFEQAMVRHYALVEIERGPIPGGSAVGHFIRQLGELSDEALMLRYAEERPRFEYHMMCLAAREFAGSGYCIPADYLRDRLKDLSPAELAEEHTRLVGPARPLHDERNPLARHLEEAVLCQTGLAGALGRAAGLTIEGLGYGERIDIDLTRFNVRYQERGGRLHVIITPKEKNPRVTFVTLERGESESRADRD